ncbi:hypothetical protein JL721_4656 [Aureococcus anophagefferens]|nr:hypothetical protein JL721_4656 [Aureococcus anophagefferens]
MADNGHVLEAGKPPRWPWLCPKPAIVQRFSGSRDGALCAFLKAGEADLHCDQAHLLREICVRLRGDAENFAAIGCAGKAAAEDALRPTRKQAAPAEPGSSSLGLRCAPGYRAAIFQVTDDKHYDLWSMYAAARDSLALGLRSRARECGYAVASSGYGSPAAAALGALGYGDVAIFVGEAKELQFASDACDRDARGVHAILARRSRSPVRRAPGIDEVWHYAKSLAASAPRPPTARENR